MCVAVPAGDGNAPRGILLGGGPGVQYIEPPAAVAGNNDLAAARGEVGRLTDGMRLFLLLTVHRCGGYTDGAKLQYTESPAAVAGNNDLAAVRGEVGSCRTLLRSAFKAQQMRCSYIDGRGCRRRRRGGRQQRPGGHTRRGGSTDLCCASC